MENIHVECKEKTWGRMITNFNLGLTMLDFTLTLRSRARSNLTSTSFFRFLHKWSPIGINAYHMKAYKLTVFNQLLLVAIANTRILY